MITRVDPIACAGPHGCACAAGDWPGFAGAACEIAEIAGKAVR